MNAVGKVVLLQQLAEIRSRALEQRLVHCHAHFTALHPGVVEYLDRARALGDFLIVSVAADSLTENHSLLSMLSALDCVDALYVDSQATPVEMLQVLKPHLFVKPGEFERSTSPQLEAEKQIVLANGGHCLLLPCPTAGAAASSNFTSIKSMLPSPAEADALLGVLERFAGQRVVVVGDYIQERYIHCDPTDPSTEQAAVVVQPARSELFDAGAATLARQLSAFGAATTFVTGLGDDSVSQQAEVRLKNQGIVVAALHHRRQLPNSTRYLVEQHCAFELRDRKSQPLDTRQSQLAADCIIRAARGADAVVFADYGCGFLSPSLLRKVIPSLRQHGVYVAVASMCESPSGASAGADLICLTERQMRVALNDQTSSLEWIVETFAGQTAARHILCAMAGSTLISYDTAAGPTAGGSRKKLNVIASQAAHAVDLNGAAEATLAATILSVTTGSQLPTAAALGVLAGDFEAQQLGPVEVGLDSLSDQISRSRPAPWPIRKAG